MTTAAPAVRKATPVLVVDDVTPCAEFWEKLGFQRTVEVPHEERLGFVILARDGVEITYQSVASVQADHAELGKRVTAPGARVAMFVEVADLEAAAEAVAGAPVFMPRRTTFYGMHEIGVSDPGGHVIILAQPSAAS
jgi:uncharacterized glyoxalase superfamily protein PhnB